MEREAECVNKGRQQVSLQENRVNDRKEMAGDCRPKTVCDKSLLNTEDSMTATWKGKKTEDARGEEEEDTG